MKILMNFLFSLHVFLPVSFCLQKGNQRISQFISLMTLVKHLSPGKKQTHSQIYHQEMKIFAESPNVSYAYTFNSEFPSMGGYLVEELTFQDLYSQQFEILPKVTNFTANTFMFSVYYSCIAVNCSQAFKKIRKKHCFFLWLLFHFSPSLPQFSFLIPITSLCISRKLLHILFKLTAVPIIF